MSLICLAGMPSEIYIAASCTTCSLAYTAIASLACCAIKELDPLVDMDWYSTLNTLSYSGLDYITIHTPVPKVTREEWLLVSCMKSHEMCFVIKCTCVSIRVG